MQKRPNSIGEWTNHNCLIAPNGFIGPVEKKSSSIQIIRRYKIKNIFFRKKIPQREKSGSAKKEGQRKDYELHIFTIQT